MYPYLEHGQRALVGEQKLAVRASDGDPSLGLTQPKHAQAQAQTRPWIWLSSSTE